jgi:NigD-like C-terminal beta sandwich domain
MKRWIFAFSLVFITIGFTSCLKDEDVDNTEYLYEMAFVTRTGFSPSFTTDEGKILNCQMDLPSDTLFKLGDRVFLTYSWGDTLNHVAKSYPINLKSYNNVVLKNPFTLQPDSVDLFYNQPIINIDRYGISGNYLNIIFYTYYSALPPNSCELVRYKSQESVTPGDSMDIYFEIKHNTPSVFANYFTLRLLSYNLNSLVSEFPHVKLFKLNVVWTESKDGKKSLDCDFFPLRLTL